MSQEEVTKKVKLQIEPEMLGLKESALRSSDRALFKCSHEGCGFTTDNIEKFIEHKISSYHQWLKSKPQEILTDECIDGICDKVLSRIKKKLGEEVGERGKEGRKSEDSGWRL